MDLVHVIARFGLHRAVLASLICLAGQLRPIPRFL
jgi:hypothetical protein